MTALSDLIRDLEAATDGSEALAMGWKRGYAGWYAPATVARLPLPRFTRSADAALSCIPEGHKPDMLEWFDDGRVQMCLVRNGEPFTGNAATSALAICAAALLVTEGGR